MKKYQFFALVFSLTALLFTEAKAVQVNDSLGISGGFYWMYKHEMTSNVVNRSGGDVNVAWMNLDYKVDSTWSAGLGLHNGRWAVAANGATNVDVMHVNQAFVKGSGLWGEGSYLTVGMQNHPWWSDVDAPFMKWWMGTYTAGHEGIGIFPFWDNGLRAGGELGNFTYSLFVRSGQGWTASGITTDNAQVLNLLLGYRFMENLRLNVQYEQGFAGQGTGTTRGGHSTTSAALTYQGPVSALLEYHMISGDGGGNAYASLPQASLVTYTGKINANVYGLHLHGHFNETWGLYARYLAGNDDYCDKLLGINQFPWTPSHQTLGTPASKATSKINVGPTFVLSPKGVMGALTYEMGTLTSAAKTAAGSGAPESFSAIKFHVAAFF